MANKMKCAKCQSEDLIITTEEELETRMCPDCGYNTMSELKVDSEFKVMFEVRQPKIVIDNKFYDEDLEQYWYPVTLSDMERGAVIPEQDGKDSLKWGYIPIVPIPIMERIQYPIEGKTDEYHETKFGVEDAVYFDTFSEAYEKFMG